MRNTEVTFSIEKFVHGEGYYLDIYKGHKLFKTVTAEDREDLINKLELLSGEIKAGQSRKAEGV